MIKKVSKADIETWQLNKFLQKAALKIVVSSVERGSDPPDFVIKTAGRNVSIEITRLLDTGLKEKEEFKNRIIKHAETLFRTKYNSDLYCLITFLNVRLDGGQALLRRYSEKLFNEIERIYLKHEGQEFNVEIDRQALKSEFLDKIRVRNTMGFNHWQHFSAHKVDWIDMNRLQSVITRKEQNIGKYVHTFDENWLLLISNIGTKSSSNRFDFLDFGQIVTTFDKVFVYKEIEDEIYVIK